jgi:hypothetical protein
MENYTAIQLSAEPRPGGNRQAHHEGPRDHRQGNHTGMTVGSILDHREELDGDRPPSAIHKPYCEMVTSFMLELMYYLRDHGYKTRTVTEADRISFARMRSRCTAFR